MNSNYTEIPLESIPPNPHSMIDSNSANNRSQNDLHINTQNVQHDSSDHQYGMFASNSRDPPLRPKNSYGQLLSTTNSANSQSTSQESSVSHPQILRNPTYRTERLNEKPELLKRHTSNTKPNDSSSDSSGDSSDEEVVVNLRQAANEMTPAKINKELQQATINSEHNQEDAGSSNGGERSKKRGHWKLKKKSHPQKPQKSKSSDSPTIEYLRNLFLKIFNMSLLFQCFIYWLPIALILFIPLAVGAWGNTNATIGSVPLMWIFIWLEVVWGAIFLARFVAHLVPSIYVIITGIFIPKLKKYRTVLEAIEIPITLVFASLAAVSTFLPVMTRKAKADEKDATQEWQRVIQNILAAIFVSSLVYFAERLLIHLISVSFHKKRFANRIKDNKHYIFVLSELLFAACKVFPPFCPEFREEDEKLQSGKLYQNMSQGKTQFAKKIAKSHNIQRLFGRMNHANDSIMRLNVFEGNNEEEVDQAIKTWCNDIVSDAINSKGLSEILARRIWESLVLEDAEALTIEDLEDIFGKDKKDDYEVVFQTLDRDGNGDLNLDEMISAVKDICHERKSIYRSLKDVDTAIAKLHHVLLFIVLIIIIIIFIGLLAPSVTAVLATLGTSIIALSFVFSTTAQEITASCVFLFVKHPIDVGDRVDINNVAYFVKEISLLYTVFTKVLDSTIVQAPNSVLNTLWIDNISRSGPQGYQIELMLGLPETTYEQLQEFNDRLDEWCAANDRDYFAKPFFYCTSYPDLDRVKLVINVVFRSNFADGILYSKRRNKLIRYVGRCINELGIHVPRREDTSTDPGLPFYYSSHSAQAPPYSSNDEFTKNTGHRKLTSSGSQDGQTLADSIHTMNSLTTKRAPMGFKPATDLDVLTREDENVIHEGGVYGPEPTELSDSSDDENANLLKSQSLRHKKDKPSGASELGDSVGELPGVNADAATSSSNDLGRTTTVTSTASSRRLNRSNTIFSAFSNGNATGRRQRNMT